MARAFDVFNALFDAVSSQVSHGKADEITVNPSSPHVSQNDRILLAKSGPGVESGLLAAFLGK